MMRVDWGKVRLFTRFTPQSVCVEDFRSVLQECEVTLVVEFAIVCMRVCVCFHFVRMESNNGETQFQEEIVYLLLPSFGRHSTHFDTIIKDVHR